MKLKVALVYGGKTLEHEVSVLSALQAYLAFDDDKYEVMLVYLDKNNQFYLGDALEELKNYVNCDEMLKKCKKVNLMKDYANAYFETEGLMKKKYYFDIAFLVVHGKGMEDGTLHSLFSFHEIPYVGTTPTYASISQDKIVCKQILEANQLSVVPYIWFYKDEYEKNGTKLVEDCLKLGLPLIVKASSLGSSIGVYKVNDVEQLKNAISTVINYDEKILVEKAIVNFKEVNCALFKEGNEVITSDIEEVFKNDEILSYNDKYQPSADNKIRRIIPARVDREMEEQVYNLSKASYRLLNNKSIVRIDFLIDLDSNTLYFNEINTIPGSLAHYLFEKKGIIYPLLLDKLVETAVKDYIDSKMLIKSYDVKLYNQILTNNNKLK